MIQSEAIKNVTANFFSFCRVHGMFFFIQIILKIPLACSYCPFVDEENKVKRYWLICFCFQNKLQLQSLIFSARMNG